MAVAFYFYTVAVMFVCMATAATMAAAYFVSRSLAYLYLMAPFLLYLFDMSIIFLVEYLGQGSVFANSDVYSIQHIVPRTLFSLGVLECALLVVCHYFLEESKLVKMVPAAMFVISSFAVVTFMDEGPFQQWAYYSLRQLFMAFIIVYFLVRYLFTKNPVQRMRVYRYRRALLLAAVFTLLIFLEDTFVILVWDPSKNPSLGSFLLYISERNFTENIMIITAASLALKKAAETLQLRYQQPPSTVRTRAQRQAIEILPSYCDAHGLTLREQEILELVLQGKNNQNIASELQLALGTVKTHVHNILKKTGQSTRQDLVCDFWKQ